MGSRDHSNSSDLRSISSLARWSIWFAALVGISVAVLLGCLYQNGKYIDGMMYGAIVGLALVTFVSSFLVALHIDRQTKLAAEQVKVLEEVDSFDDSFRRIDGQPSDFRRHIANLYDNPAI